METCDVVGWCIATSVISVALGLFLGVWVRGFDAVFYQKLADDRHNELMESRQHLEELKKQVQRCFEDMDT